MYISLKTDFSGQKSNNSALIKVLSSYISKQILDLRGLTASILYIYSIPKINGDFIMLPNFCFISKYAILMN